MAAAEKWQGIGEKMESAGSGLAPQRFGIAKGALAKHRMPRPRLTRGNGLGRFKGILPKFCLQRHAFTRESFGSPRTEARQGRKSKAVLVFVEGCIQQWDCRYQRQRRMRCVRAHVCMYSYMHVCMYACMHVCSTMDMNDMHDMTNMNR